MYSDEQEKIALFTKQGYNIIVDAVAGSGKTTSIEVVAQTNPEKRILVLLYNRKLVDESKRKLKFSNLEVRTIHSFSQKAYGISCETDDGLIEIVKSDIPLRSNDEYDLVIIDEAQDLYTQTASVLHKILRDLGNPQRIFMGDKKQCIYQHIGSDHKYLTKADILFPDTREWRQLPLSTTYRLPPSISNFVNYVTNSNRMISYKSENDISITYLLSNWDWPRPYLLCNYLYNEIKEYLNNGYSHDDIAILAPSLKTTGRVNEISNFFSNKGIKIYKPYTDYSELSERPLRHKLVDSSIHQFKGRERKIIIYIGFDTSLYKYYNHDNRDKPNRCPNRLYVALTRSTEHLYLVHFSDNDYFQFIDPNILPEYVNTVLIPGNVIVNDIPPRYQNEITFSVSDLIRHIRIEVLNSVKEYYTVTGAEKLGSKIDIKTEVKFKDREEEIYYEDISAIYGTLIPYLKSRELGAESGLIRYLEKCYRRFMGVVWPWRIEKLAELLFMSEHYLDEIAFLCNFYNCLRDKYIHPLHQIPHYKFVHDDVVNKALKNLNFLTGGLFERPIKCKIGRIVIVGAIDCVTSETVWEFKCNQEFREEHFLQLAVYASIIKLLCKETGQELYQNFKLYNILTGEARQVEVKDPEKIISILVNEKIKQAPQKVDIEELKKRLL